MPNTRVEIDPLGAVKVPFNVLYGSQTQRALDAFPVHGRRSIGSFPNLIISLMIIKSAAAGTNSRIGLLDKRKAEAIAQSAKKVIKEKLFNQFPIHFLHGGGGTSANMNANEVLANMAEETLGGLRGQYKMIHPNDHVNLHQSTNDVYPTACHIAVVLQWSTLKEAMGGLIQSFGIKSNELGHHKRLARTCLQDAVDVTFGDLLGAYESFLKRVGEETEKAVEKLYGVNLGGTMVGRKDDVPRVYRDEIIPSLNLEAENKGFYSEKNLFDAAQNSDPLARVSSQLDTFARGLIKIAQDFRLLSSGPEAGLGEIYLPAIQPGSSMIPGKINPVIPEFLIQVCFQVMGHNLSCQTAIDHGELDLNIWESVMVFNILSAMELLTDGITSFDQNCVRGFNVNIEKNIKNTQTIIPRLGRLAKKHGYSEISRLCSKAGNDMEKLRKLLSEY